MAIRCELDPMLKWHIDLLRQNRNRRKEVHSDEGQATVHYGNSCVSSDVASHGCSKSSRSHVLK